MLYRYIGKDMPSVIMKKESSVVWWIRDEDTKEKAEKLVEDAMMRIKEVMESKYGEDMDVMYIPILAVPSKTIIFMYPTFSEIYRAGAIGDKVSFQKNANCLTIIAEDIEKTFDSLKEWADDFHERTGWYIWVLREGGEIKVSSITTPDLYYFVKDSEMIEISEKLSSIGVTLGFGDGKITVRERGVR